LVEYVIILAIPSSIDVLEILQKIWKSSGNKLSRNYEKMCKTIKQRIGIPLLSLYSRGVLVKKLSKVFVLLTDSLLVVEETVR